MIYTVTFNPSLDYTVKVNHFRAGELNRAESGRIAPGGKGINVSVMLMHLGVPSVALGFAAGFTGDAINNMLAAEGVNADMIPCDGISRINVKVKSDEETEINGAGLSITAEKFALLLKKLDAVKKGDYLVLGGSVPASVTPEMYARLPLIASEKGAQCIIDTSGERLRQSLRFSPLLIKPNRTELEELFSVRLRGSDDIAFYADKMRSSGARNVIVSLGGDGAFMLTEKGERYFCAAPAGKVRDTVGSGDSLVAGFLSEYSATGDAHRAFLRGVAAGSASAFCDGLADKEATDKLFNQLLEQYGAAL